MSLGSFSARYLTRRFPYRFLLPLTIILIALSLVLIGALYNLYLVIILFVIAEFSLGVFRPTSSVLINEMIPSDVRATVLSLYSTVISIFSSGGSYLAGYMAKNGMYSLLYLISGVITIISTPILFKSLTRKE
jgi:MFS family permease